MLPSVLEHTLVALLIIVVNVVVIIAIILWIRG